MKLKELEKLMNEFYGEEDEDGDFVGGVYEDNYPLAEWARENVPELFSALHNLLKEKENK